MVNGLTERQAEVLRRTRDGQRDWEIAEGLHVGIGSVRNMKQAIRRRTGAAVRMAPKPCRECQRLQEQAAQFEAAAHVWRAVAEAFERRLCTLSLERTLHIEAKP